MFMQTKAGVKEFDGQVTVELVGFQIKKENEQLFAVKKGKVVGEVVSATVEGKKVVLDKLVSAIDPAELMGKNPVELSREELVALTEYLKSLSADKLDIKDKKAAKKEATKKVEEKTGKKVEVEEDEAAAETEYTLEELQKMGAKGLWKDVVQPIVDELEGISSRSKKDEMLAAVAEYYGLTEEEEEDENDIDGDELPEEMEDEIEEDDDFEDEEEDEDSEESDDEDDEEEDDLEDDEDEDEEESDEEEDDDSDDEEDDEEEDEDSEEEDDEDEEDDEEYDEEEEEEEDDDDELTPEDIDAMASKEELTAIIKKYNVEIPKGKLNVKKVKSIIKKSIFGEA